MTVYVDQPMDWGLGVVKGARRVRYWCHMMADTEDELHEMAQKVGLKREWFQGPPKTRHPHYDLTRERRQRALDNGAVEMEELTPQEALEFLRKITINAS